MRHFYFFCNFLLFCLFPYSGHTSAFPSWGTPEETPAHPEPARWGEETQEDHIVSAALFSEKTQSRKPEEIIAEEEIPLPPWLRYAVAVPDVPEDAPMIAIVIDDLGLNKKMTRRVIELPAPLTASFLAYADNLHEQTARASQAGHELLVHTPMEPLSEKHNAGTGVLKTEMTQDEIRDRLDIMLNSFEGYVGINNHMGSKFTADAEAMEAVIDEVKRRGLLFLDSLTSGNSTAKKIAQQKEIPYAVRNVFLDNTQEESKITDQLRLLERQARKHKMAVGIGHPHQATVDALKKWIPGAKERGVVFVPVSMIAAYLQDEERLEHYQALNRHDEWD